MERKAQVGVMVAAGGMIFGLMIAPIPNVASEYVLGNVLGQMEYHVSRQEALLDGVQITSGSYFPNFHPTESYVEAKMQSGNCNTTLNPGGNRILRFDDSISGVSGCRLSTSTYTYSTYQTGNTIRQQKADMNNPPKISFYPNKYDPSSSSSTRPNGILLSVQGGNN